MRCEKWFLKLEIRRGCTVGLESANTESRVREESIYTNIGREGGLRSK